MVRAVLPTTTDLYHGSGRDRSAQVPFWALLRPRVNE